MFCFTGITLMHFTAFIIYLLFAASVYQGGILHMRQRMLLFIFLGLFAVDSLIKIFLHNECTTMGTAGILMNVCSPIWFANSAITFLLSLGFNGKNKLAENKYLYFVIALYVVIFTALNWLGMVHVLEETSYGWFSKATGTWGFIYSLIDDFFIFGSLFVMAYQTYREPKGLRKKQGIVILLTAVITITLMYSLRMLETTQKFPFTSNITVLFVVVGIAAAIRFYGFVELTPSFAASAIFNATQEMMLLIEPDGTIAKANKAFIAAVNKTEKEINGINLGTILEGGQERLMELIKEGVTAKEVKLMTGSVPKACLMSVSLLRKSGVMAGAAVVMSDISELSKAQNELEEYKTSLEDMVTSRTLELDNANVKLRLKAETAVEFTKASHHDLMEPIVAVSQLLQLVQNKNRGILDKDSNRDLDEAFGYTKRMHSLIKDMRDYINIDYLAGENTAGNLSSALTSAMVDYSGKIIISCSQLPEVLCPNGLLKDMFGRLIDNSVKFSEKSPVNAWVSAEVTEGGVTVTFEDDGPGVDGIYYEKIFGVFERLQDRLVHKGNGIGLAICRKIAETHGGRIWATNSEKGGLAVKILFKKALA